MIRQLISKLFRKGQMHAPDSHAAHSPVFQPAPSLPRIKVTLWLSHTGSFSCIREICPVNRWLRKCPPSWQAVAGVHSLVSGSYPPLPSVCSTRTWKTGVAATLVHCVWNCSWYLASFINIRWVNEAPCSPADTPCYTAISLSQSTKELWGSCWRPSSLPHRPRGGPWEAPSWHTAPSNHRGWPLWPSDIS